MGRLAVAGGPYLLPLAVARGGARVDVGDGGHAVALLDAGTHVLLPRHGLDAYLLPHEIDYVANLRALAELGCDRLLAIGSVGGLREELGPGTFVCPDDFIALDADPTTMLQGEAAHRVAGFDGEWRARVLDAWVGDAEVPIRNGGVYWQTRGPRLETPAEVRLIADHAHVVGMTIGSECVAAGELGLSYAAVCVVDNLANGIGGEALAADEIEVGRVANAERLEAALEAIIPALAA